jgi:signal transduction histidine kinase
MVYGFMTQAGGHVALRSAEGKGTTVTLYFAAAAPSATGT